MIQNISMAIRTLCSAIRSLPRADGPLNEFTARGLDRGRYDATFPIREELAKVLDFLEPFEQEKGAEHLSELPRLHGSVILSQIERVQRITQEITVKCQVQPPTGLVLPSYDGSEASVACSVESAYNELYSALASLRRLAIEGTAQMKTLLGLNKFYRVARIAPTALRKAFDVYRAGLPEVQNTIETLTVTHDGVKTPYELAALDQILSERQQGKTYQWSRSDYVKKVGDYRLFLAWTEHSLSVEASAESEAHLRAIAQVFEGHNPAPESSITEDRPGFTIFIGHGRNGAWRELKDHLRDHHHFAVDHYERMSNSGLPIWSRVSMMLQHGTMALLVLTGEDIAGHDSDKLRARQNVIHELGLCQGRFGINRAIALVESGIELPSNILGLEHIPFSRGNIRETFGAVLAAIRREFPESY